MQPFSNKLCTRKCRQRDARKMLSKYPSFLEVYGYKIASIRKTVNQAVWGPLRAPMKELSCVTDTSAKSYKKFPLVHG